MPDTQGEQIDPSDLDQAVEIIRQRVDANGVAEAEIATQGDTNIIVSLPGNPDQATWIWCGRAHNCSSARCS